MGRKNQLSSYTLVASHSLAAPFFTSATNVKFLDNVGIQIEVKTTNSTGKFKVQTSLNGNNWIDLPLAAYGGVTEPFANAADDDIGISVNQIAFEYIRVGYTPTVAGTGTCTVSIGAREI